MNILGILWVTKAILPEFRKNRHGTIINVTSTMPHVGLPLTTLYCATKMAIEGFSNALYFELKPLGIRVRLVQPGSTRTNSSMPHDDPGESLIQDYISTCNNVALSMKHHYESRMVALPDEVAEVIYEAAVSKSSRFRFVSGLDAKIGNFMKRLLPEDMFRNITSRMMGLN
jgi:short-subunit dehydrogenase